MNEALRALVAMCAAVGARNRAGMANTMDQAAAAANPDDAEEALLQSYLFVGYPIALQALSMWRERTGREPPAPSPKDPPSTWRKRGEAVCEQVYAGQYKRLRGNISKLHPDMERWMLEEGYGKVLSRPQLDLKVRELCIIGVLVGLDAPQQLYSHLRGALNVGATPDEVELAVDIACGQSSLTAKDNARKVWRDLKAKRNEERGAEAENRNAADSEI